MANIQIKDFSFTYPQMEEKALDNIDISINEGEFVVICGPSGCGKTTLLSQIKSQVRPEGSKKGQIIYDGMLIEELSERRAAQEIGFVFQDPESQIVLDVVIHELAFSMENMGYEPDDIRKSVAEMANFFGLEKMLYKSVHELSGGEKQILNLASVLLLKPKVLLLDEPTSQLDPIAARQFLSMVDRINHELSITVILTEHRLEDVFSLADKIVIMEKGKIKYLGSPKQVSFQVIEAKDKVYEKYLPSVVRLYFKLNNKGISSIQVPMDVKEAKPIIKPLLDDCLYVQRGNIVKYLDKRCKPIIELKDVFFRYEKDQSYVLRDLMLKIHNGDFLTVLGGNGTGKSTLIKIILGLEKPQRGKVFFKGKNVQRVPKDERFSKMGYLAQNPMLYFINDTVEEELLTRAEDLKKDRKQIEELIQFFNLGNVLKRHPYDLSGGEKQKLALAIVLMSEPRVLLLDEPTKGLDPVFKEEFELLLEKLQSSGITMVMVSHDIEFAARVSTSCALLFDGQIVCKSSPNTFFSENYFYTTAINRTVREKLPGAIVVEDVVKCKK